MKPIPNVTWRLICREMPCDSKFISMFRKKRKEERALSTYFQRMDSTKLCLHQIWENGNNKRRNFVLNQRENDLSQENSLLVRQRMSNFTQTYDNVKFWTHSISQAVDHNSKGAGNKTASKWETNHLCNPSHPYFWICGRYLSTISCIHVSFFIKFIPALFVTNGLISGYSVMSKHTKEDILDGTVSVMVMSFFCGLGVYSHRLAYR